MGACERMLLCGLRGLSPQLRGDADVLCVCCDGDSLGGAFGKARFCARAQAYSGRSSQDAGVKWRISMIAHLHFNIHATAVYLIERSSRIS